MNGDKTQIPWWNIVPWLIPLLGSLVLFGYRVYDLTITVSDLKHRSYTEGEKLKNRVIDVEYRIKIIEDFCCKDKLNE